MEQQNFLDQIIKVKKAEVSALKKRYNDNPNIFSLEKRTSGRSFTQALLKNKLSIIGEIKRRSPSKGALSDIPDPLALAQQYIQGGVDALSILTDQQFFSGSLDDLQTVSNANLQNNIPCLRKDFIIDYLQIHEAIYAGADAILLIVAVLGEKTKSFIDYAQQHNIDTLVEVHSKIELDLALDAGAKIIGVNNRNLKTFDVDIQTSLELIRYMPDSVIKVSESGLHNIDDIQAIKRAGFDAVLIGESLVKNAHLDDFIRKINQKS